MREVRDAEREGSSTGESGGSTPAPGWLAALAAVEPRPPAARPSRWHRAGVSHRVERALDIGGRTLLAAFALGWAWTIAEARRHPGRAATLSATPRIAAALTSADAPTAAYLTDASLTVLYRSLRGASGKLQARITAPGASIPRDSLPRGVAVGVAAGEGEGRAVPVDPSADASGVAPRSGVWRLAASVGNAIRPLTDFSLIAVRPRSEKVNGRVGLYYIGNWPGEGGRGVRGPARAPADRYQPPSGFIEVTPQNADTRVSEHFTLRDFLTHDQPNVWPKYLVLQLRNVDKLELVLSDLAARGIDVRRVTVMSGFRTPQYNRGGGDPSGRAGLSRHMYGDAADIFIDSDGNGTMDDLNRDGRVDINDSRVIQAAVDRVEAAHPDLVGGAGVYPAESGHGPFIHIDTRGYRARWVGSGGG